jgi:hypothetical protein
MSSIERIQKAEAEVQQMQDALEVVQSGLARAEHVAAVADDARQRSGKMLKIVLVLLGLGVVAIVISRRRRGDDDDE